MEDFKAYCTYAHPDLMTASVRGASDVIFRCQSTNSGTSVRLSKKDANALTDFLIAKGYGTKKEAKVGLSEDEAVARFDYVNTRINAIISAGADHTANAALDARLTGITQKLRDDVEALTMDVRDTAKILSRLAHHVGPFRD